jgi:hypothetical protein
MGRFLGAGQFRNDQSQFATGVFNVSSNTQLEFDAIYYVNTTVAAVSLTLPTFPSAGNFIHIIDINGQFDTFNCIVLPSGDGSTVGGFADNLTLNLSRLNIMLQYSPGTNNWVVTNLI